MSSIIALHVLASGPVPWRDNMLAIAALRFDGRRVTGRFSTLVRPVRRPARYALQALGREASEFDNAPRFAEIEADLRTFLAGDVVVGLGVRVTLEFLAAELSRINAGGLANEYLELAELADERGLIVPKLSLGDLASALGLNPVTPGQVEACARLTAQVAARLLERQPIHRAQRELATSAILPDRWALLDPGRIRSVAERPGTYVFRGHDGDVLYAGSAGNLRRRLASYQSRPLELERRMEGLAERVWEIETHPADGYLEALIDEARLIESHVPPFNIQRQARLPRRFLRASTGPRPGIQAVDSVRLDGAIYLGPFVSARVASQALALARAVFPELGRQKSFADQPRPPARRRSTDERARQQAARAQAVRDALAFLSGQRELALGRIRARASVAAAAGDHQEIERLRLLVGSVAHFEITPSPLRDGPQSRFAVTILDSDSAPRAIYHLSAGHILERHDLLDPDEADAHLARWRAESPRVTANPWALPLIMRWLALQGKRCVVTVLPPISPDS